MNPEKNSGGIPFPVTPGSRGMKRMGPIHEVPLKWCSYTNRDWHEESGKFFSHTLALLSPLLRGVMQTVRSENRQNLMRLFYMSGNQCFLIGVCVQLALCWIMSLYKLLGPFIWLSGSRFRKTGGEGLLIIFSPIATLKESKTLHPL